MNHIDLARPPRHQLYYENLAEVIASFLDEFFTQRGSDREQLRLLDVGCGTGEILNSLSAKGFAPQGVDLQQECVRVAEQYGEVIEADCHELRTHFSPASIDVVISSHMLEHVDDPGAVVRIFEEISRQWILIAVRNLSRLANLFVRKPRYINPEHRFGWDMHHLKTFLELHCRLRITHWVRDGVYLTPLHRSRALRSRVLKLVEYELLPVLAPQLASSLIVLCEKVPSEQ